MSSALAVRVPNPTLFCDHSSSPTSLSSSSSGSSSLSSSPTTPLAQFRLAREASEPKKTTGDQEMGSLRKKRPAQLGIPMVTGYSLGFGLETCRGREEKVVMEDEGDEYYSVCCKRGRRGYMEDRYSVFVDRQGRSTTQVYTYIHSYTHFIGFM